jgi:hypothetical protein
VHYEGNSITQLVGIESRRELRAKAAQKHEAAIADSGIALSSR